MLYFRVLVSILMHRLFKWFFSLQSHFYKKFGTLLSSFTTVMRIVADLLTCREEERLFNEFAGCRIHRCFDVFAVPRQRTKFAHVSAIEL